MCFITSPASAIGSQALAAEVARATNEEQTLTTNLSILSNTINAEVVAFIVDNNGNVLNARKASLNESQEYQFN